MMTPNQTQRKQARHKSAMRKACQAATRSAARRARRTMGASFNSRVRPTEEA